MTSQGEPRLIRYHRHSDDRGDFSTPLSQETLSFLNLKEVYVSISRTNVAHTIRGMHYQLHPFAEAKLLTVTKGSIFDILIDLRSEKNVSGGFKIHTFQLSDERPETLYIPRGFAHGFQTISNDTEILYALDARYNLESCSGYSPLSDRIRELWPFKPSIVKQEDLRWPILP